MKKKHFLGETQKETQQFRVFFCTSGGCSYIYIYYIYIYLSLSIYLLIHTYIYIIQKYNLIRGTTPPKCRLRLRSLALCQLLRWFPLPRRLLRLRVPFDRGAQRAALPRRRRHALLPLRLSGQASSRAVAMAMMGGSFGVFLGEPRPRPCKYTNKNGKKM